MAKPVKTEHRFTGFSSHKFVAFVFDSVKFNKITRLNIFSFPLTFADIHLDSYQIHL
jgi:hypothetical protein